MRVYHFSINRIDYLVEEDGRKEDERRGKLKEKKPVVAHLLNSR
jgi:hypothetical protein